MDSIKSTSRQPGSMAEATLEQVGEAILRRIHQALPLNETDDERLCFVADIDSGSQPPTLELRFDNAADARQLYKELPDEQQVDLFSALQSAARYALNRAEPCNKLTERGIEVHVFADQSAVELIVSQRRRTDPLVFPALRAIGWQQPLLLIGDQEYPIETNLHRLGYQEAIRTRDTTLYKHYDPTMPLVGYGYADEQYHLTVFNVGQAPVLISVANTAPTAGQLVDLRQPGNVPVGEQKWVETAQERVGNYKTQLGPPETRYPASLLEQVSRQYAVALTDENARRLLNGQKTGVVVTGSGQAGKLYVLNTPDSSPQVIIQDVQRELTLKESYLGHVFTDKDRQNLHKYGDMGRVVELIDKHDGQRFTGFVGVDKDTKTLTVLRVDQIRPKIDRMTHLKGVPLNALHKQRLIEGKAIRLDNMTSKAGTSFSAYVRVSAASRGLRFDHVPNGQADKPAPVSSITAVADGAKGTPAAPSGPPRRPSKAKPPANR